MICHAIVHLSSFEHLNRRTLFLSPATYAYNIICYVDQIMHHHTSCTQGKQHMRWRFTPGWVTNIFETPDIMAFDKKTKGYLNRKYVCDLKSKVGRVKKP